MLIWEKGRGGEKECKLEFKPKIALIGPIIAYTVIIILKIYAKY
jgi:hypothetical protein